MQKMFSMEIRSLDTGEIITFHRSQLICIHRDDICEAASKLGGEVKDKSTITMFNNNDYIALLFFITSLQRGLLSVTLLGEEKFISFKKTPSMEKSWKSIKKHAKELDGDINLTGGFDFNDSTKFREFLDYLRSIETLDGYEKIKI